MQQKGRAGWHFEPCGRSSMSWEQRIVKHPVRHFVSRRLTIVARRSEMNASKDSSILDFVQRLRKAPIGAGDANQEIVVHCEVSLFAEEASKHHRRRAADRGVTRWVFRVRWRREQGRPGGIR